MIINLRRCAIERNEAKFGRLIISQAERLFGERVLHRYIGVINLSKETSIREFYADYLDTFHRLDAEAVAMFYTQPCLFITDQTITLMHDGDEIERLFGEIISGLIAKDYDHSVVEDLSVKLLSEHLAQVSGLAIRYRKDGTELEKAGASYVLQFSANAWKFVSAMTYPAP
ncbi:MAG: ketosteroid isomerase-like protein [Gammaproteobacteria bacterium]